MYCVHSENQNITCANCPNHISQTCPANIIPKKAEKVVYKNEYAYSDVLAIRSSNYYV